MVGSKKVVKGSSVTTLIARNTKVEGKLEFSGVLEIEGSVKGNIIAESDSKSVVRILNNGRVEGKIRVPQVIINGEVVGDVHADEQLYLAEKASIEGNVHYRVIEIEKGVRINGSILQMSKDSERPQTAEKPADSGMNMQGDAKLANT
jgi:cytoskeletal protein CcmA (bactofilin family)